MSEPWTRQERINYATFGTKEAPPEWDTYWKATRALAQASNCPFSNNIFHHAAKLYEHYTNASMSVD